MKSTWVRPQKISVILGATLLLAVLVAIGMYIAGGSPSSAGDNQPQYPAYESARLFSFPGDWEQIPGTTVRLIYPGLASWEFVTSSLHPGSSSVQSGTSCASCHGNPVVGASTVGGWAGPPTDHGRGYGCQACHGVLEQRVEKLGEALVGQGPLEPDPIEGKSPFVDVEVKTAYDNEYLYMRFQWASERPGVTPDLLRWDGERWVRWGGPKPDATQKDIMPSYEDRLTVSVADHNLPAYDGAQVGYGQAGCFITCHGTEYLTKYLLISRDVTEETAGWAKPKKSKEEIQSLLQNGDFFDMLMWRAAQSGPIGYADDFYVLDYLLRDEGDSPYRTQSVSPRFMYDESKVGFNAIPEALLEEMLSSFPLVLGENAVPFDPDASFNIGDILPRRVLREPTESAGDIMVNSWWEDGQWVLEFRRKLDTGNFDDKAFEAGGVYSISLAVFDDMVGGRRHYVSFPVTLGIGVDADIKAVLVK